MKQKNNKYSISIALLVLFLICFELPSNAENIRRKQEIAADHYMSYSETYDAVAVSGKYMYLANRVFGVFDAYTPYFIIERIDMETGNRKGLTTKFISDKPILVNTNDGVFIVSLNNCHGQFSIWLLANNSDTLIKLYGDNNGDFYRDVLIDEQDIVLISSKGIDLFNMDAGMVQLVTIDNSQWITNQFWYNHASLRDGRVYFSNNIGEICALNIKEKQIYPILASYYTDDQGIMSEIIMKRCGYRGYIVLPEHIIYYNDIEKKTFSKSLFSDEEVIVYDGKLSFRLVTDTNIYTVTDDYVGSIEQSNAMICSIAFDDEKMDIRQIASKYYGVIPNIPCLMAFEIASDSAISTICEECMHTSLW